MGRVRERKTGNRVKRSAVRERERDCHSHSPPKLHLKGRARNALLSSSLYLASNVPMALCRASIVSAREREREGAVAAIRLM